MCAKVMRFMNETAVQSCSINITSLTDFMAHVCVVSEVVLPRYRAVYFNLSLQTQCNVDNQCMGDGEVIFTHISFLFYYMIV